MGPTLVFSLEHLGNSPGTNLESLDEIIQLRRMSHLHPWCWYCWDHHLRRSNTGTISLEGIKHTYWGQHAAYLHALFGRQSHRIIFENTPEDSVRTLSSNELEQFVPSVWVLAARLHLGRRQKSILRYVDQWTIVKMSTLDNEEETTSKHVPRGIKSKN